MEINKLNFTRYLYNSEVAQVILNEYFYENAGVLNMLEKYEEISYLDLSSQFFFLYREREKFIHNNSHFLNSNLQHLQSVFGLLFIYEAKVYDKDASGVFTKYKLEKGEYYYPISFTDYSFPIKVNFEYEIKNINDVISYIYLFLSIEILRIINLILQRYQSSNYYGKLNLLGDFQSFNDTELLLIFPFLFKNLDELKSEIKRIFEEQEFETVFDDKFEILKNKFNNILDEISHRTKHNYLKYFNFFEFRKRGLDLYDENEVIEEYLKRFNFPQKEAEYYITFYRISNDFQLPNIDFLQDFDLEINIENSWLVNEAFPSKFKTESTESRIKIIENSLGNLSLKSNLEIIIDTKEVIKLFDKFIDLTFSGVKQPEFKKVFSELVYFIKNESAIELPKIQKMDIEDIKHFMGFFDYFKGKIFNYKIKELKTLLLIISDQVDHIENSSIDKAHLRNFKLTKEKIRILNSTVPIEFL
ncbi:hypothetical protein [Chryseobacterium sp. JUb7]|uniref:hypothetical protein n=1 Tax=Chryseobacterium sp. JUb7 TaxID=2940599 RepID=UPI0021687C1A|nr:hypothetical protein [Chryseobacterium sp. JUb7]MCS3529605.1 hypothetical protein [Chryseobacterium sp. JUb7]